MRPTAAVAAAEAGAPAQLPRIGGRPGSDFMVDVIKSLDIDTSRPIRLELSRPARVAADYGGNKKPEFLTCLHEESSVGIGARLLQDHRQAAAESVPRHRRSAARRDGDLQRLVRPRAGDRDGRQRSRRRQRPPGVPTIPFGAGHRSLVRDFTKWDDNPVSLPHFAESFVRAYKIAMTPPQEPVSLARRRLQQEAIHGETPRVPRYVPTAPPQGELTRCAKPRACCARANVR
jgi:hypothetical protein